MTATIMMVLYHYVPAVLSSLFRVCAYVFLKLVPFRLAQPVLHLLYFLHLATAHRFRRHAPQHRPWTTLCFSLQSPRTTLSLANILVNTLLLLAALDFTVAPFFDAAHHVAFTRVGAVYPDAVKILVRNPSNDTLRILYRETAAAASPWKSGPTLHPDRLHDWVQTVRLSNLWPSTKYEYTVVSLHNTTTLPFPTAPVPFRTFPDHRLHTGNHFRFIATSCITPNFPYRGPLHKNSIAGFDLLADYLQQSDPDLFQEPLNDLNLTASPLQKAPTSFLLFLGDFIYADVPVYVGDNQAAYERLYRRNYLSSSFRKVYEQLPIIHIYDDHEIINNYAGNAQDSAPYVNASAAYNTYAGNANYDPAKPGQSYYSFRHGDVAFFVMDTRRYRTPTKRTDPSDATMLGEEQLTALYAWLSAVNTTASFKFVVSSVPFTSLWKYDAQVDSWAAYPKEKAALLRAFYSVPNVVIVSGDRHEFAAIEFNPPDHKHRHIVREISTSPLSMFNVPFIRAMHLQSTQTFVQNITVAENVTAVVNVPYERAVAYLPKGNSKWSTFELDTRNPKKPTLRVETVIDGKPSHHLEILGAPSQTPSTTLGTFLSANVKDFFERMGLKPERWF